MRRVARLGLRSLHIFYYHVDVCWHRNVAVAYAGMCRFAGSVCGDAVAEGAIRPQCFTAYAARGVAVGGFVGVEAEGCRGFAVLKGLLMWTCEEGETNIKRGMRWGP
jgi:hypothetical protein